MFAHPSKKHPMPMRTIKFYPHYHKSKSVQSAGSKKINKDLHNSQRLGFFTSSRIEWIQHIFHAHSLDYKTKDIFLFLFSFDASAAFSFERTHHLKIFLILMVLVVLKKWRKLLETKFFNKQHNRLWNGMKSLNIFLISGMDFCGKRVDCFLRVIYLFFLN